jgi:TfoX/Sxy family transcriptional regulator of competence genes
MFGGLAFLVHGNMAIGVSGQGGLMVRVDPVDTEDLLAEPGAAPMVMRGRPMTGWLRIAADAVTDDAALARWVRQGVDHARQLPPK